MGSRTRPVQTKLLLLYPTLEPKKIKSLMVAVVREIMLNGWYHEIIIGESSRFRWANRHSKSCFGLEPNSSSSFNVDLFTRKVSSGRIATKPCGFISCTKPRRIPNCVVLHQRQNFCIISGKRPLDLEGCFYSVVHCTLYKYSPSPTPQHTQSKL